MSTNGGRSASAAAAVTFAMENEASASVGAPISYDDLMARKRIGFDTETQQALELLSRDSGKSLQQLADEVFADLLANTIVPAPSWMH